MVAYSARKPFVKHHAVSSRSVQHAEDDIEHAAWLAQARVGNAQAVVRILMKMSLDIRVADWHRSQGHDAVHLRDEGVHRMPNGELLEKALSGDPMGLTSDLDFGKIAAAVKDTSGKVLRLRLKTVGLQT